MTSINLLVEYMVGEIVYLVTDVNRLPRQVTGYLYDGFKIMYRLQQGEVFDYFYAVEITTDKYLTV